MKYICVEDEDGNSEIIIFSNRINHDVMAESVERMKNQTHGDWERVWRKPVSAGFVSSDRKCYGRSETLGVGSRPEDTDIFIAQFSGR